MDHSTRLWENKCQRHPRTRRSCQTFVIKIFSRDPVYVTLCCSDEFDGGVVASGFRNDSWLRQIVANRKLPEEEGFVRWVLKE